MRKLPRKVGYRSVRKISNTFIIYDRLSYDSCQQNEALCNQFVTIKQIRCVESRAVHVTFREGLTKCLKVNEVAYPLYFSTSFYTYPLYYRRPLHDRPDLVVYLARRVDVPRNQRLEKHVSKLSIIAFTRRFYAIDRDSRPGWSAVFVSFFASA